MSNMNWTHRHAVINGIPMHYVEQGEGLPVVLCHGFPHLWFSWHRQIAALAAAGYRVIAPDMRGMGQTAAPPLFQTMAVLGKETCLKRLKKAPQMLSAYPDQNCVHN